MHTTRYSTEIDFTDSVEAVIIVAKKFEYDELKAVAESAPFSLHASPIGHGLKEAVRLLGRKGPIDLVLGDTGSSIIEHLSSYINLLHEKGGSVNLITSCGVCCGRRGGGFTQLGDIVVPKYSMGLKDGYPTWGAPLDTSLYNFINGFWKGSEFLEKADSFLKSPSQNGIGSVPNVWKEQFIYTSPTKIPDDFEWSELDKKRDKVIAGDMEAFHLMNHSRDNYLPCVVVKAVQDHGHEKSTRTNFRAYSSRASAFYLLSLIERISSSDLTWEFLRISPAIEQAKKIPQIHPALIRILVISFARWKGKEWTMSECDLSPEDYEKANRGELVDVDISRISKILIDNQTVGKEIVMDFLVFKWTAENNSFRYKLVKQMIAVSEVPSKIASILLQYLSDATQLLWHDKVWRDIYNELDVENYFGSGKRSSGRKVKDILQDKSSPDCDRVNALRRVYRMAALAWTPEEAEQFAKELHFSHSLWERIIANDQSTLHENEKNHLHKSNEVMANEIAEIMRSQPDMNKEAKRPLNLRIVEGGVGGLNTTRLVLEQLTNSFPKSSNFPINSISYLGYEINPAFCDSANAILRGEQLYSPEIGQSLDTRASFFLNLRARDSVAFSPIQGGEYILQENMWKGIAQLIKNPELHNSLDLFMASYSFHHVPHREEILGFIQREPVPHMEHFSYLPHPAQTEFCHTFEKEIQRIIRGDKHEPADHNARWPVRIAKVISEFLHPEPYRLEGLRDLHRYVKKYLMNEKKLRPEHASLFIDHQRRMVMGLKVLLKSGGVVAIADPDGTSIFNEDNMKNTAEIAVAHFRTREQLCALFADIGGFDLVLAKTSAKTLDSPNEDQSNQVMRPAAPDPDNPRAVKGNDFIDPNLGYLVIAKKL